MSAFDVTSVADDADTGYLVEVSLHYPEHLHDSHNCLPLCPRNRHVTDAELSLYANESWKRLRGKCKKPKGETLLCTLQDKDRYVLHYRNLKLYTRLGMRITQVHSVIQFEQGPWLKEYIDFNTQKRSDAQTEFERLFYKLLNNSVFGELIECVRKHIDVSLTNSGEETDKTDSETNVS